MNSIISEIISIEKQARDVTEKNIEEKSKLEARLNAFYEAADALFKTKHEELVRELYNNFESEKEVVIQSFKNSREARIAETEKQLNSKLDSIVNSIVLSVLS